MLRLGLVGIGLALSLRGILHIVNYIRPDYQFTGMRKPQYQNLRFASKSMEIGL